LKTGGRINPRLSPTSREITVPLPAPGVADTTLENLPSGILEDYQRRAGAMPTRVFFEELGGDQGFARLTALVTWMDPTNKQPRQLLLVRFVEDPFRWGP